MSDHNNPSHKRIQWEYYKTRLCSSVGSQTPCQFGERCVYAHSSAEVRQNRHHELSSRHLHSEHHHYDPTPQTSTTTRNRPIMWEYYKTRLCRSVGSGVSCEFGDRCMYAHTSEEVRPHVRPPQPQQQQQQVQSAYTTTMQSHSLIPIMTYPSVVHHHQGVGVPSPMTIVSNSTISSSSSSRGMVHTAPVTYPVSVGIQPTMFHQQQQGLDNQQRFFQQQSAQPVGVGYGYVPVIITPTTYLHQ